MAKVSITPTLVPELNTPLGKARWRLGNHSATAFTEAGKFAASPMPRQKRAAAKPRVVRAKAWLTEARLQITTAQIIPTRTPKRSSKRPEAVNITAYET